MLSCTPLKIVCTIIAFVFINVIYFFVLVWIINKRFGNKSVNQLCILFCFNTKPYMMIPAIVGMCSQISFLLFLRPYSAKAGDVVPVKAFNRLPLFTV